MGKVVNYLVYNGKLIVGSEDSITYNVCIPVVINTKGNYSISVTATHTNGVDDMAYGLFFGGTDVNNYFSFVISNNGSFRVSKNTLNQYTELVKWTYSPVINKGNYTDNILQVTKEGTNWNFFINGKLVTNLPAQSFLGNQTGVTKRSNQRIEFDDYKIVEY